MCLQGPIEILFEDLDFCTSSNTIVMKSDPVFNESYGQREVVLHSDYMVVFIVSGGVLHSATRCYP